MYGGVGSTLREARRRRGIDLAEVEASTKIRARFLRAIEDEEWDLLPGDAYTRSFIRTYAAYLGVDGDALAERQRQETGSMRPVEALPRGERATLRQPRKTRRGGRPGRALALLLALAAVGGLIVVALLGGEGGDGGAGGSSPAGAPQGSGGGAAGSRPTNAQPAKEPPAGFSLQLAATAEVWVCLLDGKGEELVDGQILSAGAVEGPYRSGSFTVSLGNGEVTMTVDGQQASIPETPDPIGFVIGRGGSMRELSEGERPTCT